VADKPEKGHLSATEGGPVVFNATCYEDLEVLVLGLQSAENQGKRFVYRCAASFIKARGGFKDRPAMLKMITRCSE
jgi:hypothetical protein